MKQILVVAIALIVSLDSSAQYEESSKYWEAYYNRKNDPETWKKVSESSYKELNTLDYNKSNSFNNTLVIKEFSNDKVVYNPIELTINLGEKKITFEYNNKIEIFSISSKYNLQNDEIFYSCTDSSKGQILELTLNYSKTMVVVNRGLNSLSGFKNLETIYYNFGEKHSESSKLSSSIGGVGGYSLTLDEQNIGSASWGIWLDLGYFGLEFHQAVSANYDSEQAINYMIGNNEKLVVGGTSTNLGVFFKPSPKEESSFYLGSGLQIFQEISTSQSKKNIKPYFTLGIISKISEDFTFKGGVLLSKQSMINLGFGFNLKK